MAVGPVHHVSLSVSDLDRSVRFYSELLGMRVTMRATVADDEHDAYLRLPPGTEGKVALLQVGPPVGAVQLIQWSNGANASPPKRPGNPGVFLLAFELSGEDIDQLLARLAEHGVTPWTAPVESTIDGYGRIRTVIVEDPDGTMIEFLELPTREEIERHRRSGTSNETRHSH